MISLQERIRGLLNAIQPAIHLLAFIVSLILALLGCGVCAIVVNSGSTHKLLYIVIDFALVVLCVYLVHDKKQGILKLLTRVESIAASKKSKAVRPSGANPRASDASGPSRQTKADPEASSANHAREMARDILEKAADSLLGPVFITVVLVPLVLMFCALIAHSYGRDMLAAMCSTLFFITIVFGIGPYCMARAFLSWQFERILSVFSSESEATPLLQRKM